MTSNTDVALVLVGLFVLFLVVFLAPWQTGSPEPQPPRPAPATPATPATAEEVQPEQPTTIADEPSEPEPSEPTPIRDVRCEVASARQLEWINAGVQGLDSRNAVHSGIAVKSEDFVNAWFVAAIVYGPGIEDGAGPGVWYVTGDKDAPGLIFSVNTYAKEFSDFGHADRTQAGASMGDDGAREAERCAQ